MNNEIITKLSKFSLIMSILSVCTLGICPAFGIMGITVGIVFKLKGVELNPDCNKKIKTAIILGVVSLVLFAVDILLALKYLT